MAYNRVPYQPYDDADPNQPYPLVYPQELPYPEDYQQHQNIPYDAYSYQMNPYGEYPSNYPLRRESYDHPPRPLDYDDEMAMTMDYQSSERPRESWTERNEPSFKRDPDDRSRRTGHEPYRPRKHSDRPSSHKNLDPYTLNHIVPFTYFCDWYKQTNARTLSKNTEISKDELQDSFIKYRDDLLSRTAKDFVKDHMADAWFKEKYDPILGPTTRMKLVEYRKWLYLKFMQDLDAGKFDELTLDGAAARRYFVEKNGAAESPPKKDDDEEGSTTLAKMPYDPMAERRTPCIKTISTTVSRTQLEALLEDMDGFKYLSVSDPNPNKKFARVGWVIVDDPANPDEVVKALDDQKIHDDIYGDFTVHCSIHTSAKEQPRKALSDFHSTRESLTRDLRLAELCATKKFEAEMGEGFNGLEKIKERVKNIMVTEPTVDDEDEGAVKEGVLESIAEIKKVLDLTVEYFRRVYSFCFYCVSENDSVHELQRKCFAGHFRRPPPDSVSDSKTSYSSLYHTLISASMQKAWADKMDLFIDPQEADVVKLGGVNLEEAVKSHIDSAITREAEDRWRCGVRKCTKLFLEEKFVRSHIQKRHKDWLDRLSLESQLLNRYVLDPCRILPPAVEQVPTAFGVKHYPESKEHGPSNRFEPPSSIVPTFTGFPQFQAIGQGLFDFPEWQMGGYDNGGALRMDERPSRGGGRRDGPGGPMRRGMDGPRDHPYERRPGWHERRGGGGGGGGGDGERMRMRETRPLRSYRDLDAPQEATPELNY